MPYVINKLKSKSIIDFGCGTGEWLLAAKSCESVEKILGIDGEYARNYLKLKEHEFIAADLTKVTEFDIKFDLALSLEVAEHLPSEYAGIFVNNLTAADIILFSAAIPCQHGTKHINEQYPSYWRKKFERVGFALCDCIRPCFWTDQRVEWYYRKNMFIFCKEELKNKINQLFDINGSPIIDFIHSLAWEERNCLQYLFPFDLVKGNETICVVGGGVVG